MNFADYPLLVVLIISLILIVAASELGRFMGHQARDRGKEDISTLEASTLGLLALMIGFTFSISLSRSEARREAVLKEANSIGTTALRARMLPQPHKAETLKLLKEYVNLRVSLTQTAPTIDDVNAVVARSAAIHEGLWQQAMAVAAKDSGMVPTGLFIQTLNDMIDNQETRLTAAFNGVPGIVLTMLYGVAIVAMALTGYSDALQRRQARLPIYSVCVLIAAVILLIQDLDRPNSGFIRISQQPMIDTAASLNSYPE